MTIEQRVLEKLRELPLEKQKEVLDFVDSLGETTVPKTACRSLRGLWKGLNIQITEEDITEARREMWTISHGTSPDGDRPRYPCGH